MYRIDNASSTASLPTPGPVGPNPDGYYDSNTVVEQDALNAMQEEICYVIEQQSISLSKTNRTQLKAAIDAMIAGVAQYPIRAWAVIDMTGPTLTAGGNIASVSSAATGDITINFTSALPSNYAVFGHAQHASAPTADSNVPSVGISRRTATPLGTTSAQLGVTINLTGTAVALNSPILTVAFCA